MLRVFREHEDPMKKTLFTFLLSAAAVAFICNCGDDNVIDANSNTTTPIVSQISYLYKDGSTSYIIDPYGVVTNVDGETVGLADIQNGVIYASDNSIIADGIDFSQLTLLYPPVISSLAWVLSADQIYVIYPDGSVTDASGSPLGVMIYYPDPETGAPTTVGNIVGMDGNAIVENVDVATLKVYQPNIDPNPNPVPVYSSSSDNPNPGPGPVLSSSSNPNPVYSSSSMKPQSSSSAKSSSSNAKSSSSEVKSSSSSAPKSSSSSQGGNGSCPTIKTKSGGRSGSGWATRYWDCCKPHCSWDQHAGGNHSRQCTNKGRTNDTNWGNGSVCDGGGSAMTCISQIPFTIDGCSDMAFAFAAVPASDGGSCGKCYQLTFDGKGKYKTDANTKALNGKKLIVMTTNVGTDVSQGQFDVMIPGGGVGIFNGCSSMGWGSQGAQYGGLLADCEGQSKDLPSKVVTCLKDKCNSVFSNDSEAKKGCLFLAEWMHAAGNPTHKYTEVECPDVLKQKY